MTERLKGLGATKCPVCENEDVAASPYPVILSIGGFKHPPEDSRHDPEHNVRFCIQVTCRVCGYVMLFDSEVLTGAREAVLVQHDVTEEDEANLEGR